MKKITENTEIKTNNTATEAKDATTAANAKEMTADEKKAAQAGQAYEKIADDFDKLISSFEEKLDSVIDEERDEYLQIIEELKADKQEIIEGSIVGSPQYLKDEFTMHVASISIGFVMAVVGGVLLVRARKVIGASKLKIAGWLAAGLGLGIIGLHVVQMVA